MSAATKAGRKAVRLMNGIVNTAVMILFLLLIDVGCYAVWDSKQVYESASAARYEVYKPTAENQSVSFKDLQAINPDVFAWLTVYGTQIDYPVVQGTNNMKYINTNAEGRYSLSGAIFLDYRGSRDFSDFSSILYGHHMDKNTMFGEIEYFTDKPYFEARRYGMLYFDGREHGLEFFAFVCASAYDETVFRTKITEPEAQREYLERLLSIAKHTRDIPVTVDDRIVLFSTCSSAATNGRDILVARITEDLYDNSFKTNETDNKKEVLTVDGLPGIWLQIPFWIRVALTGLLLILPALVLSLIIHNKKRYRGKRGDENHRKGDKSL